MSEKQRKVKLQEAIKDLFASQEVLVMKALKDIEKHGDETAVTPMLEVYVDSEGAVREKLHEMLSSLKVSKAEFSLVAALEDERFNTIHADLLSFLWHCRFEPVDSVHVVAQTAIKGDFNTALEAITLVENMEGPFPDEHLMDAITSLTEYIVAHKDDDKVPLLKQMHGLLSSYELAQ